MDRPRRSGRVTVRPADVARLVEAAMGVRSHAHAPYSNYNVGAAILTRGGELYAGCNVENATYGATLCAERSAIAAMVAAGDKDPIACAVVTAGPKAGAPCGICRQVLAEFARDMAIVLVAVDAKGRIARRKRTRLAVLLPQAFRLARD
ncbi:MAG TPA: cytidine deaminase [Polyangiaceae bacterium]|jgi:cytidine deaminase|nr:cytidine deaminase [Polyangiaceae bacterium]